MAVSDRTYGALSVFVFFLAVYIYYLHPSAPYGDATELMTVAWDLAVAHPPGYPLFTLLYHALSRHVIYRFGIASLVVKFLNAQFDYTCTRERAVSMHLVTAIIGATTQLFVFLCVYKLLHDRPMFHRPSHALTTRYALWIALGTTYICGLSPVVLRYSTETEVFGLHNLFVVVILYLFVSFFTGYVERLNIWWTTEGTKPQKKVSAPAGSPKPARGNGTRPTDRNVLDDKSPSSHNAFMGSKDRMMYLSVFVCGLSLTNQHTSVLLVVPVALLVVWVTRTSYLYRPVHWLPLAGSFLLPALGPYAYLWFAENYIPHRASWGGTDTWRGVVGHFLREAYGTFRLHTNNSGADVIGNCVYMLLWGLYQVLSLYGGGAVLILVVACMALRIRERALSFFDAAFLFFILTHVVVFQSLANLNVRSPTDDLSVNALWMSIVERFWMHPFIIFVLWGGFVIGEGLPLFHRQLKLCCRDVKQSSLSTRFFLIVLCLLCGSIFTMMFSIPLSSQIGKWVSYRDPLPDCINFLNVVHQLEGMPPRTIFISAGDLMTMASRYAQIVEGYRQDIDLISGELFEYEWFKRREAKHRFYPDVVFDRGVYVGFMHLPTFVQHNTKKKGRPVVLQQYDGIPPEDLEELLVRYQVTNYKSFLMVEPNPTILTCADNIANNNEYIQNAWNSMDEYTKQVSSWFGINLFDWENVHDRLAFPWQRNTKDIYYRTIRNDMVNLAKYVQKCFSRDVDEERVASQRWFQMLLVEALKLWKGPRIDSFQNNEIFDELQLLIQNQLSYLANKTAE